MEDDDDYMSDKFIVNMEKCNSPGLIMKHSDKRAIAMTKRKAEADIKMIQKKKLHGIMEQEKREEGLSSAISTDNKGFAMLMKMGYKPGQGVGKNESGRSEPIPMNIKTNRLGLGTISKKISTKKFNSTPELSNIKTNEFRDRIASKKLAQLMEIDLIKCQKVCEQLDTKANIDKPMESWYWPIIAIKNESHDSDNPSDEEQNQTESCNNEKDENKEEFNTIVKINDNSEDDQDLNEIPTDVKLDILSGYLRKQYAYCIWCGVAYDDENDLNENCPGNTRNDH